MSVIRPPAIAGQFYTADATTLSNQLDSFLNNVPTNELQPPKAIIAPHAGYIYSGPCAAHAYASIIANADKIKRVILLGPCHRVAIQGIATTSADFWQTPLGNVPIDRGAIEILNQLPFVNENDDAHAMEHSLEIHLPFLQKTLNDFTLIPLAVGQCSNLDIAHLLADIWGGEETLIVVSTDLSHFHDYDTAQAMDNRTAKAIESFDWQSVGREDACGRIPMSGLLTYAKNNSMQIKRVGLCNSGDTAGDKSRVVGYGAWVVYDAKELSLSADQKLMQTHDQRLRDCVVKSIIHGLKSGEPIKVDASSFTRDLQTTRATFVTLTKGGQLRGCIGSIIPHRPLITDLAHNAYSAAFSDPRFKNVTADELPQMEYSISLLSPMVEMKFKDEADLLNQLTPHIDGLLIKDLGKQSVFLPQVWDQLRTPETFLRHLKQKAGLDATHWSDSFQAWTYQVAKTAPHKFPTS